MPLGTVCYFDEEKGYGFIETDDADEDVFFHAQDIAGGDPSEGQPLEFAIKQSEKGPRAHQIQSQSLDGRAR